MATDLKGVTPETPPTGSGSNRPSNYGNRPDGTPKGRGFLGELKRPDGNISTEVSVGVNILDREMDVPSLVPTLTQEERDAVLRDEMPESVVQKAREHAMDRLIQGKPVFATDDESPGVKPWQKSWGSQDVLSNAPDTSTQPPPQPPPWQRAWGSIQEGVGRAVTAVKDTANGMMQDQLFNRVLQAESGNRHTDASGQLITSPAGARGAAQLMPGTQKDPGFGITPAKDDSEAENKRVGREYLGAMVKKYDGDYEKAVAAYNAGPGNVDKAITKGGSQWIDFLPKKRETIPYMNKILGTNYSTRRKSNAS